MVGAVLLTVVAFAGSFTHVQRTVAAHGQTGWLSWAIAFMPEAMVALAVWTVRCRQATAWTWVTLVSACGFTLAGNLAQAEASVWGWVVAGWPAWAAVSAVGMLPHGARTERTETAQEPRTEPAAPAPVPAPRPARKPSQKRTQPARKPSGAGARKDDLAARRRLHEAWRADRTLGGDAPGVLVDRLGITRAAARAQLSRWEREEQTA